MGSKDKTNKRKDEVIDKIREIVDLASDDEYIYRGQSGIIYPKSDVILPLVTSTLYRAMEEYYSENGGDDWHNMNINMNLIQEEVLKAAQNFANYENDEMLSLIQHYSGDTNLIDFTKDYLVALFFACNQKYGEKDSEDGKVLLLKRSCLNDSRNDSKNNSEIEMIIPIHPPNRVTVQKSVFVQSPTGMIPEDRGMMKIVEIPFKLKKPMLDYLDAHHDISLSTIYNDLHGYVRNRKEHGSAVMEFYLGVNYSNKRDNAQSLKEKDDALEKAMKYFDKAIRLDPNFAIAYYNRGVVKRDSGDMSDAINDYDKAIALGLNDVRAYNNRGTAKRDSGDIPGAISDYDKAIALNPNDAIAYNNRGTAKRELGDVPGSMSDYDKSIVLDPNYAIAYYNRGIAKRELGDVPGAISDYDKAIALDPNDAKAYNNRGTAKRDSGDVLGAISDCDKAIALDPNYAMAYNNRGNAKQDSGDVSGAISDYDKAIALNPNNAVTYNNRGTAKRDLGDIPGAISDYDKSIALNPNYAEAYSNRGLAKRDSGDMLGEISDYDKSIALAPNDAGAYSNRGIAKRRSGDVLGAISDYDKAIALDPNNMEAYYNRGLAKEGLGDRQNLQQALSDLEKAKRLALQQNRQDVVGKAQKCIERVTATIAGMPES